MQSHTHPMTLLPLSLSLALTHICTWSQQQQQQQQEVISCHTCSVCRNKSIIRPRERERQKITSSISHTLEIVDLAHARR